MSSDSSCTWTRSGRETCQQEVSDASSRTRCGGGVVYEEPVHDSNGLSGNFACGVSDMILGVTDRQQI